MLYIFLRSYKYILLVIGTVFLVQLLLAFRLPILTSFIVPGGSGSQKQISKTLLMKQTKDHDGTDNSMIDDEEFLSNKEKSGLRAINKSDWTDLGIHPQCIINKEVVSAVQRARTHFCKKHIIDIACAIQNGTFYPKWLPSNCPNGKRLANRYLGCFRDQQDERILNGYFVVQKWTNTPRKCIQVCLQSGYVYAGIQYSNECFCGHTLHTSLNKLPDRSCNMKCTGDLNQTCGGYYTMAIYETGIEKFIAQVAETSSSSDKKNVKIAFLLTLNGRAIRQVYRLLKSLYRPNHYFYIHIDSRQRYMYRELLSLESKFSNIRLARKRFSTIWGGASLLQMIMTAMQDILNSPWQWDYIINLSESDFPVKTIDKLVEFLTINKGKNFVKSHGRETQRFIQKQGLDKTFVECDAHMWRIGDRDLPENIQIDGGSDWLGLSRDFVQYIIDDKDDLVKGLLVIFTQTLLPAESFFHTVLRNSRFCNSYIDNNLHITNWRRKLGCKCQYKHIVDWCGCSPNDFKPEDWPRLEGTENKSIFFARKFEPIVNHAIIVQLEEWIYGAYPENFVHLYSYWQNVYHHFDDEDNDRDGILSVSQILLKFITNKGLSYKPGKILEVTNFFEHDVFKGFLIKHEGTELTSGNIVELELWVKPNQTGQIAKNSALGKRIKLLEISTDYDQKEQISRNFAKTLGLDSEPHLVIKFAGNRADTTTSYNFTVLWYEPNGDLADISEIFIEDTKVTSISYVKPVLKLPLPHGKWLVKILHKQTLIGLSHFYVISPLLETESISHDITKDYFSNNNNGFLVSNELISNVEIAVEQFFIIMDVCTVTRLNDVKYGINQYKESFSFNSKSTQIPMQKKDTKSNDKVKHALEYLSDCRQTSWSSIASDPKSDISLLLTNT